VLVLGTVSPGVAFAGEVESEQEGTTAPGALPGLEEGPDFEPGGEEAVLEELPGPPSGGAEEVGEGPPVEEEPPVEPPVEAAGAPGEIPVAPEAPSAQAPPPEPAGPDYELPPASAPVENQTLVAPPNAPSEQQAPAESAASQPSPEDVPSSPPVAPPEQEAPASSGPAAATPAERQSAGQDLAGRDSHTVQRGECLWSIATALLPPGAGNAAIAAEVARLWRLNASRIGTGDPNLLLAGTELKLH
jgi:outer membrane biosynthesis protein TonB